MAKTASCENYAKGGLWCVLGTSVIGIQVLGIGTTSPDYVTLYEWRQGALALSQNARIG